MRLTATPKIRIAWVIVSIAIAAAACSSAEAESDSAIAAVEPAAATAITGESAEETDVPTPTSNEPVVETQEWEEVSEFELLYDTSDSCVDVSLVHSDGLTDFATVDDLLISRDLITGEITEHGPPPTPCAIWLGDERAGLWWASADDAKHVWFGQYGESWDVEKEWSAPAWLLKSQVTASNRLIFINESDEIFLVDGVTGEPVGSPVGGGAFGTIDNSTAHPYVAVGYRVTGSTEGSGLLYVLDDKTGEELHRIPTELPAQALVFDDSAMELVAGMAGGDIITIDLISGDIVAEVETAARTAFLDIGIRPDGSVIAVSNGQIDIIDRHEGSISVGSVGNGGAARIRPDGTPVVLNDQSVLVYAEGESTTTQAAPDGPSLDAEFLAEQVAKVDVADGAGAYMLAVMADDSETIYATAGADPDGSAPIPADLFRVGSITKVFTSAATLLLVDDGLVDLDEPANSYVSRVPVPDGVTVRNLLGHTSGIFNYTDDPSFFEQMQSELGRVWSPEEVVDLISERESQFEPGSRFSYSNANYIILGILIEEVTGQAYHEVVRERILEPSAMTDTDLAGSEEGPAPYTAYSGFLGSLEPIEFDYTAIETSAWTAGAMVSSAEDLHKLFTGLFGGQIISASSLGEAIEGLEYGLGIELWESSQGIYGHGGGIPGYSTMVRHAPETGRTAFWVATSDDIDPSPAFFAVFDIRGS